jgi:hypothetical protein
LGANGLVIDCGRINLSQEKGTVVVATVRGNVHDIGKNLVDIILINNGTRSSISASGKHPRRRGGARQRACQPKVV